MQIVMAAAVSGIIRKRRLWAVLNQMPMDCMICRVMCGSGHPVIMVAVVNIKFCGAGRGTLMRAVSAHPIVITVAWTIATTLSASVAPSKKLPFSLLHFYTLQIPRRVLFKRRAVKKEIYKKWFERVKYDIDTAEAMYSTGRYIYAIFMCQQSIEKSLKALLVFKGIEIIPVHNLRRLAEASGVINELDKSDLKKIDFLSQYYLNARYKEDI